MLRRPIRLRVRPRCSRPRSGGYVARGISRRLDSNSAPRTTQLASRNHWRCVRSVRNYIEAHLCDHFGNGSSLPDCGGKRAHATNRLSGGHRLQPAPIHQDSTTQYRSAMHLSDQGRNVGKGHYPWLRVLAHGPLRARLSGSFWRKPIGQPYSALTARTKFASTSAIFWLIT
jgi:hypothetical protein